MVDIDPAVLGFVAGIAGTVSAFAAKYAFDYRLGRRRLELDERAALATTLGGRPGQLRRASIRLGDRVESYFRDAEELPTWLTPAADPARDGYFLRSSTHRVFLFLSWGALMQQSLDALPSETLRARRDLQAQYALLDLGVGALTSIAMFPAFPGYPTDRAAYNLFTGTVDEIMDLGVAAYHRNAQVIPSEAFDDAYDKPERAVEQVRFWISHMGAGDVRSAVIRARFACVAAVLQRLGGPDARTSFLEDEVLTSRLSELEPVAGGYALASVLPRWMDEELARALSRCQGR